MTCWLILTATLPTQPSGLRVRVWRALKATGAASLREGVYLLPEHAPSAQALRDLERTIVDAGADAYLLQAPARDAQQEAVFRALFDRADLYAQWQEQAGALRANLARSDEAALRKGLRTLEHQLREIQSADFFVAEPEREASAALAALRRDIERRLSPDEPERSGATVIARAIGDYQGRTWATRRRPWVDRLATAWLIRRFIDRSPTFLWLADAKGCPPSALGYDFDGATFTHVGERVTFEVVAESFGLLQDPALRRLGALVRCIDVGGPPVDEAAGFEMLVRGLQARHADDDGLLGAACEAFDAAHAALGTVHEP
jgi:hypothetical protein